jgi:sulfur-oxidizing protein SoxA
VTGRRRQRLAVLGGLALGLVPLLVAGQEPKRAIAPGRSALGREFVSPETQAQQDDLSVNPGMLWVEQGEKLWREAAGADGKSCALVPWRVLEPEGRRARYPVYDAKLGRLLNLEGRIQHCRAERQKAARLPTSLSRCWR